MQEIFYFTAAAIYKCPILSRIELPSFYILPAVNQKALIINRQVGGLFLINTPTCFTFAETCISSLEFRQS
jgi:hypothetical protein